MFLVNLDCFDVWKVETNVGQPYFDHYYFFLFSSIIISAVTPSQSVFLIIRDGELFGSGSQLYAAIFFVLLIPLVLKNPRSVKI